MKITLKNAKNGLEKAAHFRKPWMFIFAGAFALSVAALSFSLANKCMMMRFYRFMDTAQKALPVMKKAAEIYIDKNADVLAEPPLRKAWGKTKG